MSKAVTGLCMGCMSPLRGSEICPICGYSSNASYDENYIKPGTVLGSRYIVGRLVHKNGEGARYIGYDNNLQQPVQIQEYFPYTIAERGVETGNILPLQGYGAQYKAQMSDFLDICNEIKRLSITEPVIPIENVLSENNTIYAVYKEMNIVPLEHYLREQGGRIALDGAAEMFMPLLNTLSNIHGHGQIHRGISPYTVYVDQSGKLYLWDFALAATRTAGSELEAELFSGYSAPEQYSPSGWQGTWTDVYAVGALLYWTLSGVVPPKSTLIGTNRPLIPLEDLVMGLPKNISQAVADAMNPSSDQRTQAMATLTSQLIQGGTASTAVYDTHRVGRPRPNNAATYTPPTVQDEEPSSRRGRGEKPPKERGFSVKYVVLALSLTVVILLGLIVFFMYVYYPELMPTTGSGSSASSSQSSSQIENTGDGNDMENTGDAESDIRVPSFIGSNYNDLQSNSQYTQRYQFVVTEEFSDDWAEGMVMAQDPLEGTTMSQRGTVNLTVSKGPLKLEVPELIGLSLEEAIEIIEAMGEENETTVNFQTLSKYDDSVEPGTVLSVTPDVGEEFEPKRQSLILFVNPERQESSREESSQSSSSQHEESSRPFFHY